MSNWLDIKTKHPSPIILYFAKKTYISINYDKNTVKNRAMK